MSSEIASWKLPHVNSIQSILRRHLLQSYHWKSALFSRLSILTVDLAIEDVLELSSASLSDYGGAEALRHLGGEEMARFWLDDFEEQARDPRRLSNERPRRSVEIIASRLSASVRFSLNQRGKRESLRALGAPPGVRALPQMASLEKERGQGTAQPDMTRHRRAAEISAQKRAELRQLRSGGG